MLSLKLHCQKYLLGYLLLRWQRSRHLVFVRIRFQYGNQLGTLYAGVTAYGLNWLRDRNLWLIGHAVGHQRYSVIAWLRFLRTQPDWTTLLSRHHLGHLWLSRHDIKNLHRLSKCCQLWGGCSCVSLGLHNCRNIQFSHPVLQISLREVVGHLRPSRLGQFIKPHLLVPKALHMVLYPFKDCAQHPAMLVILTQLAKLCIFFMIILILTILLVFRTCKSAQPVPVSFQHLLPWCLRLCGCQLCLFDISHMFLLWHICCRCVLNSLSGYCPLSIHKILNPFHFLLVAWKVVYPSFARRKLLSRSKAAQRSQRSDPFCLQATLGCICLMTSSCGYLHWFAIFARQQRRKVCFPSIHHCILCWPCCWARCWMLQDMDHMEASCVIYVKVGRYDQIEQSKISVLPITSLGIVMLAVHYDLMVTVWFM